MKIQKLISLLETYDKDTEVIFVCDECSNNTKKDILNINNFLLDDSCKELKIIIKDKIWR